MALELVGKLVKILPEVTGQGKNGPWNKQEFVLETLDTQYPKKVCMTAWGDKAGDLKQFADGDMVKATFSPESREYNERWYTELRAYRIETGEGASTGSEGGNGGGGGYAAPPASRPASAPAAPRPAQPSQPAGMPFNTTFEDDSNDLPF